jgi:hypothetical protein
VQAVLQELLPELLFTPQLPLQVVLLFVRRDIKPTYQQLVDAARARVMGVEMWAQLIRSECLPGAAYLACKDGVLSQASH